MGFDSTQTQCEHSSHLGGAETFTSVVAELIIQSSLETSIASALTDLTELPL